MIEYPENLRDTIKESQNDLWSQAVDVPEQVAVHMADVETNEMATTIMRCLIQASREIASVESEAQSVARHVKESLDSQFPCTYETQQAQGRGSQATAASSEQSTQRWQVIVGRKFSADVTHRKGALLYASVNHVSFLVFRQR